jgi:large subunit ribosomal protein L9
LVARTVTRKAGEDEKLYGSVTAADIASSLAAQGFEVDKRRIILEQHNSLHHMLHRTTITLYMLIIHNINLYQS